jgi:cellulose synthase (UDP-forming)
MRESAAFGEDEQEEQLLPLLESQQVSDQLSSAEKPTPSSVAHSTTPLPDVPSTPPYRIHTELEVQAPPSLPSAHVTIEPTEDIHTYRVEQLQVMTARQKKQYLVLVLLWIVVNLYFWYWWLQAGNIGNPVLFTLMSLTFFYEGTLLPSFYTFFMGHMRHPRWIDTNLAERAGILKRVAVISLTVPGSESLEIVKQQMLAMKNIRYPHESWILVDKVHSPKIKALATSLGIFYFSRHDVATWGQEQVDVWNQSQPPFKAKTKAGNVNSWIDAYGHLYSHFTQLDIDHIPIPSYLDRVLGFFLDPKVKWVQAPSVYGNLGEWTARGSAEQELVLQGPLQMGFFGFCRTPFIIGSHCTYDMAAIRGIGGFQPTRAEDHLDTVFLAAQGYEGVFLPEVIAVGDGPENFETYLAQQFAWAFSMIQVLFTFTPKRIKYYTPRQTIQFLFVQTWYTFWSTAILLLFTLPLVTLFTNTPIAHVSYWQFLLHSLPISVTGFIIWLWSHPWHFPKNLDLSWRGILLHIARWPIVLSAFIQVILGMQKPYMITVKGLQQGIKRPFSLAPHYPYFFLIGLSLGACCFYLATVGQSDSQGYLLFALQGAVALLLPFITALIKDITDMVEGGIHFIHCLRLRRKPLLLLIGILVVFFWMLSLTVGDIYTALLLTK